LGTASAAKELARHLRGEDTNFDFECMFGLVGSPQHEAALSEMRRLLADPDHPVTDLFLVTMSVLLLNKDESPGVLPAARTTVPSDSRGIPRRSAAQTRQCAGRQPIHRAQPSRPSTGHSAGKYEQLAAQLPAIFDRLPVEKQY
jgi:hypothetical protein